VAQDTLQLGTTGIWTTQLDVLPAARAQEIATELEALGFGTLWVGEALGREALTHAGLLLAGTRRIVVATGIANIYARDAVTMAARQKTLAEAYPNQFLLGLGVSHSPLVEQLRGHRYDKPVATMRGYLEAMDQAPYRAAPPALKPLRVLAAFAPQMLRLAKRSALTAHIHTIQLQSTRPRLARCWVQPRFQRAATIARTNKRLPVASGCVHRMHPHTFGDPQ
jgi:probable F420-dependent oxidoreductase